MLIKVLSCKEKNKDSKTLAALLVLAGCIRWREQKGQPDLCFINQKKKTICSYLHRFLYYFYFLYYFCTESICNYPFEATQSYRCGCQRTLFVWKSWCVHTGGRRLKEPNDAQQNSRKLSVGGGSQYWAGLVTWQPIRSFLLLCNCGILHIIGFFS